MSCKIYKITCESGNVYYGSTINSLKKRFTHHKNLNYNSTMTKNFINPTIELVEECNENERVIRESYYIKNFKCINKINPIRTEEEKKEQEKKANENWRLRNKEKEKERLKNIDKSKYRYKMTCECGCIISSSCIARHRKTKKHLDLLP